MKTGIERIAEERQRQIEKEGWDASHDFRHKHDELARAGATYALPARLRKLFKNGKPVMFPFTVEWWKPAAHIEHGKYYDNAEERIRELEKAGALIAAEIDRIQDLYIS
jgi:hypothetical protein